MLQLRQNNIFEQATQLVSLDCSSIIGENMVNSHNLSHSITHSITQSLQQSLISLKTVLPTFTSEFNLFKEEIVDMSFYIVNKLMHVIKGKNTEISALKQEVEKSLGLNNSMKKEVMQLNQMILEFMTSFKKQMHIKEKEISLKQNEINQLKNVLKQNFNSPRNICQNCQQKINYEDKIVFQSKKNSLETENNGQEINNFFKNYSRNDEILIEMSESIICNTAEANHKMSLEVIQQEASDINSITDYLQSQRGSQKQNTSKQSTQLLNSSRTNNKQEQKEEFCSGKRFNFTEKINLCAVNLQQDPNQGEITVKDRNLVGKINIVASFQNKGYQDTFSSRNNNKTSLTIDSKGQVQRQRRCSEQIYPSKQYEDFKIERKSVQRTVLGSKQTESQANIQVGKEQAKKQQLGEQQTAKQQFCKQQLSLKQQMEQISKSSSSSDIMHFGDTQKINVNLPKSFEIPKNMNFVKKNSSRVERVELREERFKTEPTPREDKFQLNKENIHIEHPVKPIDMGRKIFARKKMIMTHARPNNTCRVESKKGKEETNGNNFNIKEEILQSQKKDGLIEIKFIQSLEKEPSRSTHSFKPSISTIFSADTQEKNVSRVNNCMDYISTTSNISAINESNVKSHHLYHSTGKYQSDSTPNNSNQNPMTPNKLQTRTQDRKSCSKSKEKLKVTSKSNNHEQNSVYQLASHGKRQKFVSEVNQNQLLCNNQSIKKLKSKNLSVHIGGNSKIYLKQNLIEIKQALTCYNMAKFYNSLKEVFFDGKIMNGIKEGRGRVVYDNGMNYEGELRQGKRMGQGKITLNGIDIFEGQFVNDMIEGQGYLKFLRFFTNPSQCPKILQDASYFGRFSNNNFDGMGTLFLNQKQKIVSKFSNGIPYGEITFYTQNDIEFAHWPTA